MEKKIRYRIVHVDGRQIVETVGHRWDGGRAYSVDYTLSESKGTILKHTKKFAVTLLSTIVDINHVEVKDLKIEEIL